MERGDPWLTKYSVMGLKMHSVYGSTTEACFLVEGKTLVPSWELWYL